MALPPLLCMQEAPHYRRQAQRARWLARQLTDPSDMETMHGLANDLDEIAIDLERRAIEIRHPELLPQRRKRVTRSAHG
jgi:hypothetical protein